MTDTNFDELEKRLKFAEIIAREAGQILLKFLGNLSGFDAKASAVDLVTDADKACDDHLRARISSNFPHDLQLTEETNGGQAHQVQSEAKAADRFLWCVDPLDGTTNFVHSYPKFGVSIGLMLNGKVMAGVVHAPALEETFAGGRGIPSTINGNPISVSTTTGCEASLLATGFSKGANADLERPLRNLEIVLRHCHGIRRSGSAALDLCDVACGRLDGFYEWQLNAWDVAAGQAIVEAAGGKVTKTDGNPHDPFGGSLCATNEHIHEELLGLLRD